MATISSDYTPYYIKSDAIAVFPCANRTNDHASRFTTEYNLTHLGLPNASWISRVGLKVSGLQAEGSDRISCIINGYFFEFSLKDAYNTRGELLISLSTPADGLTLTAYIATRSSTHTDTNVEGEAEDVEEAKEDPLKSQPQLCAIGIDGDTSTLDKTFAGTDSVEPFSLFLGLVLIKGTGDLISGDTSYSLQLLANGNYPYIGILPQINSSQISNNAVGTSLLADNAVETAQLADEAVTTGKIANKAVTAFKLGDDVISDTTSKLGTNEENKLQVKLTGGNGSPIGVELSGSVGNDDIKNSAVNGVKIADYAVSEEKLSSDAVTTGKIKDGNVTKDKIDNYAITTEKFASDAKAPYAGIAEKILISGKVCTIKFDKTNGTLTFSY